MASKQEKGSKKGLLQKTLERCKSLSRRTPVDGVSFSRNIATGGGGGKKKPLMAPEGCFTVYVGPRRERFNVRAEQANHPLFRALLEAAETEYGHCTCGPLELPCDVDEFLSVIWEMDHEVVLASPARCGFPRSHSAGYKLLSPARPVLSMGRY